MKDLLLKYKHIILYLVFGVITTLVNLIAYYICSVLLKFPTVPSTIIAWTAAVLTAYFTNRKWVFESKIISTKGILTEIGKFFLFRLATGVLDVVIMYVTVDVWNLNEMVMKFLSNVIVIILNYVFSKWIIFRKKE